MNECREETGIAFGLGLKNLKLKKKRKKKTPYTGERVGEIM